MSLKYHGSHVDENGQSFTANLEIDEAAGTFTMHEKLCGGTPQSRYNKYIQSSGTALKNGNGGWSLTFTEHKTTTIPVGAHESQAGRTVDVVVNEEGVAISPGLSISMQKA